RSRTFSIAMTSTQTFSRRANCSFALRKSGSLREPSRLRRVKAERTSTGVKNHTTIDASSVRRLRHQVLASSATTKGTIAEASQNLTALLPCPREGLLRLRHGDRQEVPERIVAEDDLSLGG